MIGSKEPDYAVIEYGLNELRREERERGKERKRCSECGRDWPVEEFHIVRDADGEPDDDPDDDPFSLGPIWPGVDEAHVVWANGDGDRLGRDSMCKRCIGARNALLIAAEKERKRK